MPEATAESLELSRMQRFAAFLVIVGEDCAAQMMRSLDSRELETIASEMANLPMLSHKQQKEILKEFSSLAVDASTSVRGSMDFAQSTLEKSVGLFRASDIVGRIAPSRLPESLMKQIFDMEARPVANILKNEQPQTIALVTSYLSADKTAEILNCLPLNLREDVIERMATLSPTPVEVVERVIHLLSERLGGRKPARAPNQTGGVKVAANVLNSLDKEVSKNILLSIEEKNPDLGQNIRNQMFTFEDIEELDSDALQKILREVELRSLALSLKSAGQTLKEKLLGCISKRAAETVEEEISFMGSVKMREIEEAKKSIVEVIRRLESEGELDLDEARGGG